MKEELKTILILDDDEVIRLSLVDYFEDRGCDVFAADTGEKALELLSHEKVDGAIVDLRLPGMDGNKFIAKAKVDNPFMAFIIYTGSLGFSRDETFTGTPQVCDNVVKKPIEDISYFPETLNKMITSLRSGIS